MSTLGHHFLVGTRSPASPDDRLGRTIARVDSHGLPVRQRGALRSRAGRGHHRRHLHPSDVRGHGVPHRRALPSTTLGWQLWMDASALHCTEMLPHA